MWAEIVVLRLIGSLARVAFGFALASLAAGLVTVLFVNTPADVLAQPADRLPQTAGETFELALLTATHSAVFAFTFALILALLGEWFSLRALSFYLLAGAAIALLGFIAQYQSEIPGEPTILNNYALKAFLTTGFLAGFIYWLAAGQFAGKSPMTATSHASGVAPDRGTEGAEPKSARRETETSVDITHPITVAQSTTRGRSLLHRLTLTKARPAETQAEAEAKSEDEKRDDDADGDGA